MTKYKILKEKLKENNIEIISTSRSFYDTNATIKVINFDIHFSKYDNTFDLIGFQNNYFEKSLNETLQIIKGE